LAEIFAGGDAGPMKHCTESSFWSVAALVARGRRVSILLQARASRHYGLAMTQVLNESLAAHLSRNILNASPVDPQDVPQVKPSLVRSWRLTRTSNSILSDVTGRIKAFTAPVGEVRRDRIDLGPIRDFISHRFGYPDPG